MALPSFFCERKTHCGEDYIKLDNFVSHLKEFHSSEDAMKNIDTWNIQRTFNGYREHPIKLDGVTYVPMFALLRYIYSVSEKLKSCQDLGNVIIEVILDKKPDKVDKTVLVFDLYHEVAKDFKEFDSLIQHLKNSVAIIENDIPTLYNIHKIHFTAEEWDRICIFEKQFSDTNHIDPNSTMEKVTEAKWKYYESCKAAQKVGKDILKSAQTTMQRRAIRKARGIEIYDMVHISAFQKHLPTKVESDISSALTTFHPGCITQAICVDYEQSRQNNCMYVYLTCTDIPNNIPNEEKQIGIAQCVHRICNQKHGITKVDVLFYAKNAFDKYKTSMDRFKVRDDIFQGEYDAIKISHHILTTPTNEAEIHDEDQSEYCVACFMPDATPPLHMKTFDLCSEWLFDVPAPVQFLLYPFVNRRSLTESSDPATFVEGKVRRLYGMHDVLLNIFNYKYHGIQQEKTTAQLALNYRCATSLFKLTSGAGASQSQTKAEKSLQERSNSEKLYYDSYLRPYKLQYQTDAGLTTKEVRMRDTYATLRIDNLVRLRFSDDPSPGESRSKQMCTLPVSLEGLPKDAAIVHEWHDPVLCNGLTNCVCKQSLPLTKQDVKRVLFDLSEEEDLAMKKFVKLSTWGIVEHLKMTLEHRDVQDILQALRVQNAQREEVPHTAEHEDENDTDSSIDQGGASTSLQKKKEGTMTSQLDCSFITTASLESDCESNSDDEDEKEGEEKLEDIFQQVRREDLILDEIGDEIGDEVSLADFIKNAEDESYEVLATTVSTYMNALNKSLRACTINEAMDTSTNDNQETSDAPIDIEKKEISVTTDSPIKIQLSAKEYNH